MLKFTKLLIFFFLSSFFSVSVFSQTKGLVIGGSYNDEVFSSTVDSESNFYIAGTERAYENAYENITVFKIDKNGNKVFKSLFGDGFRNRPHSIIEMKDGNLLICGESWGGFGEIYGRRNTFLLKIDKHGKELWAKNYYLYHRDQAFSVKELKSGDLLMIGYSKSFDNATHSIGDVYLLKADRNGNKIWEKSFHNEGNDYGFDFVEKENGNYLILCTSGGFYNSNQADYRYSHDSDVMFIETDSEGNEIYRIFWGTEKHDFGRQILPDVNGSGYYIIGSTQSYGNGSFDMLLLKTDENGNEIWHDTYGTGNFDYGISLDMTDDGKFLYLCGTTYDDVSETTKIFLLKTDLSGNEIWAHEIGNEKLFSGQSVKALSNGGCIVAGITTDCSLNRTNNIYIQSFDKDGTMKFDSNNLFDINVFPNPVMRNNKITFEFTLQCDNENDNSVEIYDINSKLIEQANYNTSSWSFFPSNLKAGVYFYKIRNGDNNKLSGKFIVY